MDERIDPRGGRAELLALVRCGLAPAELSAGVYETYGFHIGDERFHVIADDGDAIPRSGPPQLDATVTVECDLPTFLQLVGGVITPAHARREHLARIEGPSAAVTARSPSWAGRFASRPPRQRNSVAGTAKAAILECASESLLEVGSNGYLGPRCTASAHSESR